MFTELSRRYTYFSYEPDHTLIISPNQHPHQSHTFVTINKLIIEAMSKDYTETCGDSQGPQLFMSSLPCT